jgi:GMP synthase-like glutamine amidotransferase
MKALIIQHEDITPPGTTIDWLKANHIEFVIKFADQDLSFSLADEYDVLVLCGGSMNVDQEEIYPWLKQEKELIKKFVLQKKKIIGLCLGSQLLAEILGGSVKKHPHWEVGWQKVNLDNQESLYVFEWHGYSFTLPPKAKLLASNEACAYQSYTFENHIFACQFHPESTIDWALDCANDPEIPAPDKFIQSSKEIRENLHFQKPMQEWYFSQLSKLIHS